jgi:protein TonB
MERPWRISHRRGRRLGPVLVISLWLHLTFLLLLLVTVRYEHIEEELPPPSTVAMVFEGGQKQGPAVPERQSVIPAPTSPPKAPPAPEPPPPSTAESTPVAPPTEPAPPVVAATPAPPTPSPPAAEALPLPPPPPPLAMVVPRPPSPAPRPTQPPSMAQPAPTPSRPPAFPAPMNFSFNAAPVAPSARPLRRSASRAPATLDFSLAPRQGATDNTPFSRVAGAHVGPDWRNELSAWVRAHAYYPEQAAMNGEDGDVMVRVVANPDGRVASVQLEQKSGSMWLDLALQSMFRDAHLPPLHDETEPITFDFLMHYILIRVQ